MSTAKPASNIDAPTQFIEANGGYARQLGPCGDGPARIRAGGHLVRKRGCGSIHRPGAQTIAGMATHTLAFLDALGVERCDVLGFSLGGMVAQQIAHLAPSLFLRMILVGTAPRGGEDIMHLGKSGSLSG